jgi:hypothetical protein
MGGISLAIGLTCVGMGLPMIAAESGFWDRLGVFLLAVGTAMTLVGLYLIRRQSTKDHASTASAVNASSSVVVGPAMENPQAGRDIYVGDTYNLSPSQERSASLSRAIANALTELDAIRLRLMEAAKTGRLIPLPANHHQPVADLMADQGWFDSRRILDDAYNTCDNLQNRLKASHRRWDGGPIPEMVQPTIEEDDNLPDVLQRVEAAIEELRRLQTRSAD